MLDWLHVSYKLPAEMRVNRQHAGRYTLRDSTADDVCRSPSDVICHAEIGGAPIVLSSAATTGSSL